MKTKLLILFCSLCILINTTGADFGKIGTEWYYAENAGGMCPGNCEYVYLKSIKDTVINGITTNKIINTYYRYRYGIMQLKPFYIYEKSDTVYRYSFNRSKFLTFYIFNAKKGDTLILDSPYDDKYDTTYRIVIDSVKEVIIDGIKLKRYYTTSLDEIVFYGGGYMDRIGGFDWFYPRGIIIPEAGGPIRCYKDSQIDTSFTKVACDYISPYNELGQTSNDITDIYPNPASESLYIKSNQSIEKVIITDLSGKILISAEELKVNLKSLVNGYYFVLVQTKDGQLVKRKFVKLK